MTEADILARLASLREQRGQALRRLTMIDGAIEDTLYWQDFLQKKEHADAADNRVDGSDGA